MAQAARGIYLWLAGHRGSGSYLREISPPGVGAKFAERHRGTLAGLLGVSASATAFISDLRLRAKPALVRVRFDPAVGLPGQLSELAMRSDELCALDVAPRAAVVCENETTYLTVPVPSRGLVISGKGFDVDRVGRLSWLKDVEVTY